MEPAGPSPPPKEAFLKLNGHPIYTQSIIQLNQVNNGVAELNYPVKPNLLVSLIDRENRYIHLLILDDTEIFPYEPPTRNSDYLFKVLYFKEPPIFKISSRKDIDAIERLLENAKEFNYYISTGIECAFRVVDNINLESLTGLPLEYVRLIKSPASIYKILSQCKIENINVCNERNFYKALADTRLSRDRLRIDALTNDQIKDLIIRSEETLRNFTAGNINSDLARKQTYNDIAKIVSPLFPYEIATVKILRANRTCPEPETNCSLFSVFLLKFVASIARDVDYTITQILSYLSNITNLLNQNELLLLNKTAFNPKANIFPIFRRIPKAYEFQIVALLVDSLDEDHYSALYNSFFTDMPKYQASKDLMNANDRLFKLFLETVEPSQRKEYLNEYNAMRGVMQLVI